MFAKVDNVARNYIVSVYFYVQFCVNFLQARCCSMCYAC